MKLRQLNTTLQISEAAVHAMELHIHPLACQSTAFFLWIRYIPGPGRAHKKFELYRAQTVPFDNLGRGLASALENRKMYETTGTYAGYSCAMTVIIVSDLIFVELNGSDFYMQAFRGDVPTQDPKNEIISVTYRSWEPADLEPYNSNWKTKLAATIVESSSSGRPSGRTDSTSS